MKTKRMKKIISFLCAIMILFTTMLPNLSLAVNEVNDIINNEEIVYCEDSQSESSNTVSNTNEIDSIIEDATEESNTIETITDTELEDAYNEESTAIEEIDNIKVTSEDTEEQTIVEETINEEEIMLLSEDGIMTTSTSSIGVISIATYYVLEESASSYGILAHKVRVDGSYKQVFCVEHRSIFI